MTRSPLQLRLERENLKTRSSLAAAKALKAGSELFPIGRTRQKLRKWGARTEACAVSRHVRIINPKSGDASFLAIRSRWACHFRWCMACASKKSSKTARDVEGLVDHIWAISPGARFLMLTLTSKNRPAEHTRQFVLDHQKSLKKFFAYDRIQSATLGHLTNIEIDFATAHGALTAHVHSHSLIVVAKGALSDHRYRRHAEYRALWKKAMNLAYAPQVRITAVRTNDDTSNDIAAIRSSIRETCKYCLDTEGFLFHANGHITANPAAAAAFALATYRRRLTSMDRIWLQAKKRRASYEKAQRQKNSEPVSET